MNHSEKASELLLSFGLKQKMKKQLFNVACSAFILTSGVVCAQPSINPIPAYTKHPKNFPGISVYALPNLVANSAGLPYDIGVTPNWHFQSGNTMVKNQGLSWFLCQKNATTGAPIASATPNIAALAGLPNTNPICNGMLLDETKDRIYLFGSINSRAVIACFVMHSLVIDNAFATNGVQVLTDGPGEVIDAILLTDGRFSVLMNEKDGANKSFMSIVSLVSTGAWLGYDQFSNAGYQCYGKRFRKYSYSGMLDTYYIAGRATNSASQSIPMIWEVKAKFAGDRPVEFLMSKKTSDSFTSPVLGNGTFVDIDFMPNQIVAVGNRDNGSTIGIWAKYNLFGSTLTPISTFKNGAALPGSGPWKNPFTRCLVDPDGYTVVLSYNAETSMGMGVIGYITPSGDAYVKKYEFKTVHKTSGLAKDFNGNVIVGGCDIVFKGVSTAKFTSYNGFWGGYVNKQVPSAIDEQSEITFNAFPNPATNALTISGMIAEYGTANIQIIDITGRKVKEVTEVNGANQEITIDIADLNPGSYFVRLTANGKSVMKKIVKQ